MFVKMTILRLLGSSDDKEKEKIGVAKPKEPMPKYRCIRRLSEEPTLRCLVQEENEAKSAYRHRLNRRSKEGHRCIGRTVYQRRCQVPRRSFLQHLFNRRCIGVLRRCIDVSRREEGCEGPV